MTAPQVSRRELLASHVEQLCSDHDIRIVGRRSYGGAAFRRARVIAIMPVRTQRTYIVALHEIGHIVGRGRSGTRLEQEAAAWDFVLDKTVIPLSPATYAQIRRYLDSYLRRACRRRRMIVPAPDHAFWSTYARIVQRANLTAASQ